MSIDRMRIAAVAALEADGWKWEEGKWVKPAAVAPKSLMPVPSPNRLSLADIFLRFQGELTRIGFDPDKMIVAFHGSQSLSLAHHMPSVMYGQSIQATIQRYGTAVSVEGELAGVKIGRF